MENFAITSEIVYKIHTPDGVFEVIGASGLKQYSDDIMGGFVDRMSAGRPGNPIKAAQHDHEYLTNHSDELLSIYAIQAEIKKLLNPAKQIDCDDFYCNRCGSSSEIEYCG